MNGSSGWPLRLQYGMGRLFVFLIGPVTYGLIRLAGWRVRDLRGVRRACREQFGKHEGPWLICANAKLEPGGRLGAFCFQALDLATRVGSTC